jgi:hypothetical protein
MGEYARSSAIARAVSERWPAIAIQFVLSRAAPYAAAVPFPTTWLPSSATFQSAAVIDLIRSWRPQVVIFDNAGRTAQLRAARRWGARVIYISARRRQRRKAFRWRWMRLLDEHWIAYPELIAGKLRFLERLKLALLRRPVVRYLDILYSRSAPEREALLLSQEGLSECGYALVIPGGGTGHPGAGRAVEQFLAAACALAAKGIVTLFAGPVNEFAGAADAVSSGSASFAANLRLLGMVPQSDLSALMRHARLVVTNGGSTLMQSIACGAACLAVPIANDQVERIRRCVKAGIALHARLDSTRIAEAAVDLWDSAPKRTALKERAGALGFADGVEIAMTALRRFLEAK